MNKLMSYNQVIEKTKNPILLLGNGFSMAYDKKRFSFTSLLESAVKSKIIKKSDFVYKVFEKLKTADFESVMKILDDTQKVIEIYKGEKKIVEKIKNDSKQLKSHLVKIITNNHPEICTDIPDENKKSCVKFLKPFKKIYTINYDLLLYWATMFDNSGQFTDGFGENDQSIYEGYVIYKNYDMKVLYLHGGLHIYDAGSEIIKKTYSKTGIKLVDQVKENLNRNVYPIFISEGDSEQKLTKIRHNTYLDHCYKSFRRIGGKTTSADLVILGTYLKKNDSHILSAILENNIENVYIGVSKESEVDHIQHAINNYNAGIKKNKTKKRNKNLFLYNYKTVDVWGKKAKND